MNPSIKWAIYARKSSESEERQIQSTEDQERYLRDLASRFGLNVTECICEAKSAKAPKMRQGFANLTKLIEKGKIQGILTWKFDRLSRNPPESGQIAWLLQTGKIQCIKTSDRDYLPGDNALLIAVEQGMANQYVRDLSNNVKRGLHAKAQKGWMPSIPPIGYLNTKWQKQGEEQIIEDPERFKIVRQMWDMMLTGVHSPMEIYRIATYEWKFTAPKRGKWPSRALASNYMYKIFSNVFYAGHFHYSGKLYKGNHLPMVTLDEFEKVQRMLRKKGQAQRSAHDFPFTGAMRCGNCGSMISATQKEKWVKTKKHYKTYTYYHCGRKGGVGKCKESPITSESLKQQVIDRLSRITIGDRFYEYGLKVLTSGKPQHIANSEAIYRQQNKFIQSLEAKLSKLLSLLLDEVIDETEYKIRKAELEEQVLIEKSKLGQIDLRFSRYLDQAKKAFHFTQGAIAAIKSDNISLKRSILKNLGSNRRIISKNLYLETYKWFTAIKDGENTFASLFERFEPEKPNNNKVETRFFNSAPKLSTEVEKSRISTRAIKQIVNETIDNVIKEFEKDPDVEIPDLSEWVAKMPPEIPP